MKTLFLDIETTPIVANVWQLRQEYIPNNMVEKSSGLLMWAAKWDGSKKIMYETNRIGEKECLKKIYELISEADTLVAHNGRAFDIKKLNGMFLKYKFAPYPPCKVIDTYRDSKAVFNLDSYKLDYLGKYCGHGGKVLHTGFELWRACMKGDERAWQTMIRYNKRDVLLLEEVYKDVRAWIKHPNHGMFTEDMVCTKCGSDKVQRRGYRVTASGKYQSYQCQNCGAWSRSRNNLGHKPQLV